MAVLEQRINFYQDMFRKPEVRFPLQQMATVLVGVLVVLLAIASLDYARTYRMRQQVVHLETTQARLDKAVEAMTAQLAKMVADPALVQQEQYLRDALQLKYQFLAALQAQGDTHQEHFSEVLTGLSNMEVDGIWLTRIQLQSPGPQLSLTGLTARAKALPEYLAALNRQTVFSGTSFRMLDLERAGPDSRYLTFTVSTQHEQQLQR